MARLYTPRLLRAAWTEMVAGRLQRSFVLLDAVMEHLIPPFSIMVAASAFCLGFDLLFYSLSRVSWIAALTSIPVNRVLAGASLFLGLALVGGQIFYLLAGLHLVRAPKFVYQALLQAPRLVVWKIWQVLTVLAGRGQHQWLRTERNEG